MNRAAPQSSRAFVIVIVLPSADSARVSVFSVVLPATAPSPVQVTTSLPSFQPATVAALSPIAPSFCTGLPVRS